MTSTKASLIYLQRLQHHIVVQKVTVNLYNTARF
jgi:hypothetical protein